MALVYVARVFQRRVEAGGGLDRWNARPKFDLFIFPPTSPQIQIELVELVVADLHNRYVLI